MDDQLLRFRINTNTANELAVFQDDLASMYTPESKKIKFLQEATASAISGSSYGRCFLVTMLAISEPVRGTKKLESRYGFCKAAGGCWLWKELGRSF